MKRFLKERTDLYATGSDFCRIFREDMQSLYLLSFVLTADPKKAEESFVAGLDDCASGNQVFKEWARSWARRVVIKRSIRSVAPEFAGEQTALETGGQTDPSQPARSAELDLPAEISAVLALPARERFAFVMSFCEGYSDRDCALLLGCTRETVVTARLKALAQLKDSATTRNELRAETVESAGADRRNSIEMAVTARLAALA